MSHLSLIAVPAAFVLVVASTASAQDKPSATTATKPVTTLSKAAKQATKPATVPQDTIARTVKQKSEKESAPSATQTTPVSERSYEGCHHGEDSDA
jgi:hypothetical protein